MNTSLSGHFSYGKLIRFVLPSVIMMVFTSIYGVVDGYFVSNYAGSSQFAAINLIMPFLQLLSALGFMIGAGGTALVSFYLGAGDAKRANNTFSLLTYTVIAFGLIFTVSGILVLGKVAALLGATENMLPYCVKYGRIVLAALVPFMLQNMFQSFMVAAGKPRLSILAAIVCGSDAELAKAFIDESDFKNEPVTSILERLAMDEQFSRRGNEIKSSHVLYETWCCSYLFVYAD